MLVKFIGQLGRQDRLVSTMSRAKRMNGSRCRLGAASSGTVTVTTTAYYCYSTYSRWNTDTCNSDYLFLLLCVCGNSSRVTRFTLPLNSLLFYTIRTNQNMVSQNYCRSHSTLIMPRFSLHTHRQTDRQTQHHRAPRYIRELRSKPSAQRHSAANPTR